MTEPYVKANPGDPILSENWNTLQVRLIEALRTHTHQGGDDGKKLVGSSIDPNTTLSVKQVDVSTSLSVKGLNVFDRLTGLGTEKLSVTGGTVSGPLTVSANVGIGAAAGAARLEVSGASSDDKALALRVTNSTGGVLLEVRNDGAINLHDNSLYLRGTNDTYHGIRWDADVRGPRVFGFQGGQLATTTPTDDMVALQWKGSDVIVMGDLYVGGGDNVAPCCPERVRIIRGFVSESGNKQDTRGVGFTASWVEKGLCDIKFDKAFGDVPVVIATQMYAGLNEKGGNTRDNAVLVTCSPAGARIKTGNLNGDPEKRDFHFVAIG